MKTFLNIYVTKTDVSSWNSVPIYTLKEKWESVNVLTLKKRLEKVLFFY